MSLILLESILGSWMKHFLSFCGFSRTSRLLLARQASKLLKFNDMQLSIILTFARLRHVAFTPVCKSRPSLLIPQHIPALQGTPSTISWCFSPTCRENVGRIVWPSYSRRGAVLTAGFRAPGAFLPMSIRGSSRVHPRGREGMPRAPQHGPGPQANFRGYGSAGANHLAIWYEGRHGTASACASLAHSAFVVKGLS